MSFFRNVILEMSFFLIELFSNVTLFNANLLNVSKGPIKSYLEVIDVPDSPSRPASSDERAVVEVGLAAEWL
jgi:hypothetical protein